MLHNVLFALWFMVPAAVANAVPVLAAALPVLKDWNAPLDFGLELRGRPLLGSHKTWRGIITGVAAALAVFWIQQALLRHIGIIRRNVGDGVDFAALPLYFGPLMGFGALAGDALKSLAKRQTGIASGRSWVPFDQLDYIVGAVLVSLPFLVLSAAQYAWVFILWFGVHLLFSYLGFKWGLKERPI